MSKYYRDDSDQQLDGPRGVVPAKAYGRKRSIRPKQPTSIVTIVIGVIAAIAMIGVVGYGVMVIKGDIPKPEVLMYDATPATAEAIAGVADLSGVSEAEPAWFPDPAQGELYTTYKASILNALIPLDQELRPLEEALAEGGIPDTEKIKGVCLSALANLRSVQTQVDAIQKPVGLPEELDGSLSTVLSNAIEMVDQSIAIVEHVQVAMTERDTGPLGEANFAANNVARSRDDILKAFSKIEGNLGMVNPGTVPTAEEAAPAEGGEAQ